MKKWHLVFALVLLGVTSFGCGDNQSNAQAEEPLSQGSKYVVAEGKDMKENLLAEDDQKATKIKIRRKKRSRLH